MRTSNLWRTTLLSGLALGLAASALAAPAAATTITPNTPLVINEVIQNNDQIDDAIELFNTGSDPIDLSGWALSDDKTP